jgi:hypothetical protein
MTHPRTIADRGTTPIHLTPAQVRTLLDAGERAPSDGNMQPWRVDSGDESIDLRVDPTRNSDFVDIGRCSSLLALGCFAENMAIVAPSLGLSARVEVVLDAKAPGGAFVRVQFESRAEATASVAHSLHDAVYERHTNRQFSDGALLPQAVLFELEGVAGELGHDVRLRAVCTVADKRAAARSMGGADYIRFMHDQFFWEMMGQIRWTPEEEQHTRDGLPLSLLGLPGKSAALMELVRRNPALRRHLPEEALRDGFKPAVVGSSHLCALTITNRPSPEVMVQVGRAFERLWLRATTLRLALHPCAALANLLLRVERFGGQGLSSEQVVELRRLGAAFRRVLGMDDEEVPMVVFRLSRADSPALGRTLRRGLVAGAGD